ncbi:MAG: DUF2975 domain-containing protein [Lachnospiraceae bacterium]|nr:DUF2975 domain-containing protein [Lachnospiraceae bacterium]
MKRSKKKNPETIRRNRQLLINALATAVVAIIVLTLCDFAEDIMTQASAYDLRYESSEIYPQEGKQYTMYVDGKFYGHVDQNKFCLVDEAGNTDYRYCVLMEDATRLTYVLIFSAMMFCVLGIARESVETTPFTAHNIKLVKVISLLQLSLCVLPGFVRSVMCYLRFNYSSSTFDEKGLYMLVIGFIIGLIAFVFERGLTLQEDMDSIA